MNKKSSKVIFMYTFGTNLFLPKKMKEKKMYLLKKKQEINVLN